MCVGGGGGVDRMFEQLGDSRIVCVGDGEGDMLEKYGGLRKWGGGIYLKIFNFSRDNGNKNLIPE